VTSAEAAARLKPYITRTPLLPCRGAWLKAENLQRSGSFKIRGALNRLLQLTDKTGVVCFSSGNHAQAVALAGQMLNIPVTVFMPADSMPHKVAATQAYGATVIQEGVTPETRHRLAADYAAEHRYTLVPPFDDPAIMAGQGTLGLEIAEQHPDLQVVASPLGGGGLLSGVALAIHSVRPGVRIFGVEPAAGNDGQQSFRSGTRVTIPAPATIADGARTISLGELTFAAIRQHVTDIVTVTDDQLLDTLRFLALEAHIVAEPTGALAVAAWRAGLIPGEAPALVVSGGNVAPDLLAQVLKGSGPANSSDSGEL
jgi:threonine dehydratase